MKQLQYSIVIPCYASGNWLEKLVIQIAEVMNAYPSFELILVNDKSPDQNTWEVINSLAIKHYFVRGIDLLYNVGQFRATLCGLEYAKGRFIITMDDDFQHPPKELQKLIDAMEKNPSMDCIMGKYITKQHSTLRNAGTWLVRVIMNRFYNKPKNIETTSFRIMPVSFAKTLLLYRIASPQLGPLIVSITKRIMNVPIEHHERKTGSSGYTMIRCIKETLQSVINASISPLRWFVFVGFTTSAFAFLIGAYYFLCWAFGGIGVEGFTSLILTISFFNGMLLAGLGVLGEYIGRIVREITGMPRYQVLAIVGDADDAY